MHKIIQVWPWLCHIQTDGVFFFKNLVNKRLSIVSLVSAAWRETDCSCVSPDTLEVLFFKPWSVNAHLALAHQKRLVHFVSHSKLFLKLKICFKLQSEKVLKSRNKKKNLNCDQKTGERHTKPTQTQWRRWKFTMVTKKLCYFTNITKICSSTLAFNEPHNWYI